MPGGGAVAESVALKLQFPGASALESVELLDGGNVAYPRVLSTIEVAQRSIHLEAYGFTHSGIGSGFIHALASAASRGVKVTVVIDGNAELDDGDQVLDELRSELDGNDKISPASRRPR